MAKQHINFTLNLTLKKEWFDKILSGEKTEEYREIKRHWVSILCTKHVGEMGGDLMDRHHVIAYRIKPYFKKICFTNGYGNHRPSFDIECKGISIGKGNPEWGAPDEDVFIISLGKITAKRNM